MYMYQTHLDVSNAKCLVTMKTDVQDNPSAKDVVGMIQIIKKATVIKNFIVRTVARPTLPIQKYAEFGKKRKK